MWAATTARKRNKLRKDLVRRLRPDRVSVVAEQDRRRQEKHAAHLAPPTVRETGMARLELELIPIRPAPYEPLRSR
ncbi:hypothetical protein [Streptomyces sp. NPDC054834]